MKEILWSQGLNETDPGKLVIDGVLSDYTQSVVQDNALELIYPKTALLLKRHTANSLTSTSYKLRFKSGWLILEGNYEEKDDSGRNRVYCFAVKSINYKRLQSSILSTSKKINCTPNDRDLAETKHTMNTIKNIVICTLTILAITLCLL